MAGPRQEWRTRSGVRLHLAASAAGPWNWLFVPGGPGLGSQSLRNLVTAVRVPGATWLVDLPGDGSNRDLPDVRDPYAHWPGVLVEAAQALRHVVMVSHSTGGMFMLSVPELEAHLAGIALISSAPHSGWRDAFGQYAREHPIPAVETAAARYGRRTMWSPSTYGRRSRPSPVPTSCTAGSRVAAISPGSRTRKRSGRPSAT